MMVKRLAAFLIPSLIISTLVPPSYAQQPSFVPVTDTVLQDPQAGDWMRWRRTNRGNGYSPLEQVTRENVQDLRLAWSWAMASGRPLYFSGSLL